MSGSGFGNPGINRCKCECKKQTYYNMELPTFWNKPKNDLEEVIKQATKEVETWPEWIKRNAEAIFITKREKDE